MKSTAMILLVITTAVLILLTIFASFNFSFGFIFYLVCIGQLLFIFTVYKILTDNYTTTKTFKDMYEDYSPDSEE